MDKTPRRIAFERGGKLDALYQLTGLTCLSILTFTSKNLTVSSTFVGSWFNMCIRLSISTKQALSGCCSRVMFYTDIFYTVSHDGQRANQTSWHYNVGVLFPSLQRPLNERLYHIFSSHYSIQCWKARATLTHIWHYAFQSSNPLPLWLRENRTEGIVHGIMKCPTHFVWCVLG